jgi:hypothetical protein
MKKYTEEIIKRSAIVGGGIFVILLVAFIARLFMGGGSVSYNELYDQSPSFSSTMSDSMMGSSAEISEKRMMPAEVMIEGEGMPFEENQEQKIIREGSLDVRVESVDKAIEEFKGVVEYFKGQIASQNIRSGAQGIKSGTVTVKVPQESFYATITGLKEAESVSLVLRETVSGQDVTERYVDLEAQLSNKKAEEQAFLQLLERQDDELADVISVTKELSRVRGEIERLEGQIRYLNSKTDMSTITISLSEDQTVTIIDTWRPLQEVKDAVNDLFASLQEFTTSIIRFVIVFLPMAVIYLGIFTTVFFIGRKIYRKIFRK